MLTLPAGVAGRRSSDSVVFLIGAFKLVKAALLFWLGLVSLRFAGLLSVPHDPLHTVWKGVTWLGAFPGLHTVLKTLQRIWAIEPEKAQLLAVASFAYAAVFLVEGVGLTLRKRWAEWLTVAVTASFIPIEIYELADHFGGGKLIAIALNVAILAYLLWRLLWPRFTERKVAGR
jgi:uncharacterized membrane protein (DUF2068 family)